MALLLSAALSMGCAEMGSLTGTSYGETASSPVVQNERLGRITSMDVIQVHEDLKLGIGTAVGAVAGGLLGSKIGGSSSTILGTAVGAAAGTYAESQLKQKNAQRVVVQMNTGGQLTILQPIDSRLYNGMYVRVEGSGDTARVLPR